MPEHFNRRITKLEQRVVELERTHEQEQQVQNWERSTELASDAAPVSTSTNQPHKGWYKTIEGWYYVLGIIGIPFAIGYAIVTYLQWKDLGKQFEADQRAWIKPTVDWTALTRDNAAQLTLANVGKSAAQGIHIIASLEIIPAAQPPSFVWKYKPHLDDQEALFYPMDELRKFPVHLLGGDPPRARAFEPSELADLISGKRYIALWGFVVYRDQFGQHWSRFCSWDAHPMTPTGFQSRSCVDWNSVGDGKSPDE